MKRTNAVIAGILVGMLGMRLWPHASLAQRVPLSTAVWSADRELLRVTLASTISTGCGRRCRRCRRLGGSVPFEGRPLVPIGNAVTRDFVQ